MNDISNWLYAKNAAFWTDKTGSPANYKEIIDNLRTKYGVFDLPFRWRIISSIVTFVISLILILTVCLLFLSILDHFSDGTLTIGGLFIDIIALLSVMVGAYLSSYATFGLIAHRRKLVEKDWADLFSKGILLEGKVTDIDHIRWGERRVKYEFFDLDGKRQRDYYYLLTIVSITIGDKVAVWYVDRKLHTLL